MQTLTHERYYLLSQKPVWKWSSSGIVKFFYWFSKHILYSDYYLQQIQVIMKRSYIKWKYDVRNN
jgi:hypothetical protein